MAGSCGTICGKILFRTGQVLMVVGFVCFVVSAISAYWVVRPRVNVDGITNLNNQTKVVERFGIFVACQQKTPSRRQSCGSLSDYINFVNGNTVRYIQFVMVVSFILYVIGVALEIVQFLPIQKFRNFLAMNRVVEIFVSIAGVMILKGMVIFAGEVKNKAERVQGQDEEAPGWSFTVCLLGLGFTLTSIILTIMFRELPISEPHAKGGSWVRNM